VHILKELVKIFPPKKEYEYIVTNLLSLWIYYR